MSVNVRMRSNVLCQTLYKQDEKKPLAETSSRMLAERLFYWELLDLRKKYPLMIPYDWTLGPNLAPRQRAEKDAFLPLPGEPHPWKGLLDLKPMPLQTGIVPFFKRGETATPRKIPPPPPPPRPLPPPPLPKGITAPDDQTPVIGAALKARLLILAPPGTGKTETLIRRLCAMINTGEIRSPSQEIVVLSFTRSAVEEIRRRILAGVKAGFQDNLRYAHVQTFDSFATRLLLLDLPLEELPGEGYDQRIQEFTHRLVAGLLPEATEAVGRIRYLLVDEVQDMVGPRAEMVLELARRVVAQDGGVVFFGDPAQAIYDWQQRDRPGLSSTEFLRQAREVLGETRREIEFVTSHRYKPAMREWVVAARTAMGPDGQSPDGASLDDLLHRLPEARLEDLPTLMQEGKRTAVLTRTNLEAFQIGDWCRRQRIGHTVWKGSSGDYWPGWLARLTFGFKMERMSLDMAKGRWNQLVAARERLGFEEAKEFLQALGLLDQGYFDLTALARRVREGTPRQLGPITTPAGLIISTIHRSKGLEFDRVCVLKPRSDFIGQEEEVRVLYVAATRARQELRLLDRHDKVLRRGSRQLYDHTLEHFFLGNQKKVCLLLDGLEEIDLESLLEPPGGPEGISGSELQQTLWETFAGGGGEMEAALQADGSCVLLLCVKHESAVHARHLCRLADLVRDDLAQLAQAWRKSVTGFTAVPLVDLATVAFPWEDRANADFLGSARLALAPVLYGPAVVQMN